MTISKEENDSNEVAITYKLGSYQEVLNGEDYVGVALGTEHDVDPMNNSTSFHLINSSEACIVIVLHNHPSMSDFSLSDVQFLLRFESIKMMVVITNMGSITYLVKTQKYDYEKSVDLLNKAISMNNEARNLKGLINNFVQKRRRENIMTVMSLDEIKKLPPLTESELNIINNASPTPSDDCPQISEEELKQF